MWDMARLVVLFFLLIFSGWKVSGQNNFEKAGQLFAEGAFQESAEVLEALKEERGGSFGIYYNLGNAYFKLGDMARARLNYERALLLKPYNQETRQNIAMVKDQQQEEIEEIPPFFLAQWGRYVRDLFSVAIWMVLALVFLWVGFLLYFLDVKGKLKWSTTKRQWVSSVCLVIGFISIFGGLSRWKSIANSGTAVVMEQQTELKEAPEANSTKALDVYGGTKLYLEDKIGDWYKVKLLNGEEGWLPANQIEKI
jgi:tetratricopeptide (TPR) repeat protein